MLLLSVTKMDFMFCNRNGSEIIEEMGVCYKVTEFSAFPVEKRRGGGCCLKILMGPSSGSSCNV